MSARALVVARRVALLLVAIGGAAWLTLGVLVLAVTVTASPDPDLAAVGLWLLATSLGSWAAAMLLGAVGWAPRAWRWMRRWFWPWITAREVGRG